MSFHFSGHSAADANPHVRINALPSQQPPKNQAAGKASTVHDLPFPSCTHEVRCKPDFSPRPFGRRRKRAIGFSGEPRLRASEANGFETGRHKQRENERP
jgi:hypothetical protein